MAFVLPHLLHSQPLTLQSRETPEGILFTVAAEGPLDIRYPGRWNHSIEAAVQRNSRLDGGGTDVPTPPGGIDTPGGPRHPGPRPPAQPHNGVNARKEPLTLTLQIFDPSGARFTADEVTLADLEKFRDPRGAPFGRWRFSLAGHSRLYQPNAALHESVAPLPGVINLGLLETVASSSAPPLVANARIVGDPFRAQFDLNRVGSFRAQVSTPRGFGAWPGSMRLLDPDGVTVASSSGSNQLRCDIPLALLGRSRDAAGRPRLWTLEAVQPGGSRTPESFLSATVVDPGRIRAAPLLDRITAITGPHGSFLDLRGRNDGDQVQVMLTINDVVSAETIDMRGFLDARLKAENQTVDIVAGEPKVLYAGPAGLDYGLTLDVAGFALGSLDVAFGPSSPPLAQAPAIHLSATANGHIAVRWRDVTVARVELRDGRFAMEVGVQIDPDGTPRIVHQVPASVLDVDLDGAALASLAVLPVFAGVTALMLTEYLESTLNRRFVAAAKRLFEDPSLACRLLMTTFGTHLTYLHPRWEGNDVLFEHVAAAEPEPQPRSDYAAAIGRTPLSTGGLQRFLPPSLGNTWKADNLRAKIDHIVVVMMENRSYDHVLGYRARAPISDGADGLTPELVAAIDAAALAVQPLPAAEPGTEPLPPVHPLRRAAFEANAAQRRTRIPKGVGHELADVTQQLAGRVGGPAGTTINDPRGFMENFRETKLNGKPEGEAGCTPFTVLGYYEKNEAEGVDDLPVTAFFAEHYAYCDRYFCSHPGPTLPNRMYSLTGDVQYDRLGVPILDNNAGDNFLLSRATTIYDVLTRHGVGWRVYESFPSVTMLRMFARYATDDVHIRPLDELAEHVRAGDLPAFTVIEPAMHHYPEDDDHPPADMYQGQHFLRRVYQALRSNPDTWARTLLVITYDEHGGLYDHVIPPIADVLDRNTVDRNERPPTGAGVDVPAASNPRGTHVSDRVLTNLGGVAHGFHVAPNLGALVDLAVDPTPDTDDIPPPSPPTTLHIPYGVRVPTFVISPWVTPGKGPSVVLDHCSILKTVLARFCGDTRPFLSDRVHASHSFESFLEASTRQPDPGPPPELLGLTDAPTPRLSGTSAIVTPPLSRRRMREMEVDYHDISGYLARNLGR